MRTNINLASLMLLATVGLSSNAFATTFDINTPVDEVSFTKFELSPMGAFSDTYNFTLSEPGNLAASVKNDSLQNGDESILNIPNLSMSIYDEANNLMGSISSGFSLYGAALGGLYHALVTGNATGLEGGAYLLSINAMTTEAIGPESPAAVPVPATIWLLGSGLLGLLGVSRRKA